MEIVVVREAPDTEDAEALVLELEDHLAERYPAESRHGYSVARLLEQKVAFFVARVDGAPAACGGVQLVGAEYGEIKRMWVRPQFRRLGLGRAVLEHLRAAHARARSGRAAPRNRRRPGSRDTRSTSNSDSGGSRPFPPYRDDPLSLCFECGLRPSPNVPPVAHRRGAAQPLAGRAHGDYPAPRAKQA